MVQTVDFQRLARESCVVAKIWNTEKRGECKAAYNVYDIMQELRIAMNKTMEEIVAVRGLL